jgi:hypothetical protein
MPQGGLLVSLLAGAQRDWGHEPQTPVSLAAVWAGVAHTRAVRIRAAQDTDGTAAASVAFGTPDGQSGGETVGPLSPIGCWRFGEHYRQIARPFDWTFTRADLERVLAEISEREPRLALGELRTEIAWPSRGSRVLPEGVDNLPSLARTHQV